MELGKAWRIGWTLFLLEYRTSTGSPKTYPDPSESGERHLIHGTHVLTFFAVWTFGALGTLTIMLVPLVFMIRAQRQDNPPGQE